MKASAKDKKGIRTRKKIERAARKVFSRYPYHAASMRMIGKEAGVEHPLINYYFPSKAKLFETIITDICDESIRMAGEWFDAVVDMKISEAFIKYIDLMLDFYIENPEHMKILALNIIQSDNFIRIPGYNHIINYIERISMLFEEKISIRGQSRELKMYIHSFNLLTISFLGAGQSVAQVQGLDAESDEYREMVRNTLGYIFIPRLRDIIIPPARRKQKVKKGRPGLD